MQICHNTRKTNLWVKAKVDACPTLIQGTSLYLTFPESPFTGSIFGEISSIPANKIFSKKGVPECKLLLFQCGLGVQMIWVSCASVEHRNNSSV